MLLGQNSYPKDYFSPPLDIPLTLSGNFGELRPNHFHTGFDFKTNGKEGYTVYACADGYVSRIKISATGYGKAIYITHPNGYTTVYGHLKCALGAIETKIKTTQYKEQSFEIELYLKPDELPVKKGDLIALTGNTGSSEGPHLHFEIRNTITEKIINPLFFGFDQQIPDKKKPVVSSLVAFPVNDSSVVNQSKRPVNLSLSLQADGSYIAEKVLANGKIGFGIVATDYDNVSYNQNGIYKAQLIANGKTIFEYLFDEMSFDEGRYINAFIDYARYKKLKQRVQKLFAINPYPLSNIKTINNQGIIDVHSVFNQLFRIDVSDYHNNIVSIYIPVSYSDKAASISPEETKTRYFVKYDRDNLFEKNNVSVFFPARTFYSNFYLNFDVKDTILSLHDDTVPVHSNYTISYDASTLSEEELKKTFIGTINGKKISYLFTKLEGTILSAKTKTLGQFQLVTDVNPPKINIEKSIENKWVTHKKQIQLTLSDDLSGIKTYNGYLNDRWVLFEYDAKTNTLTHNFEANYLVEGKNVLKVIVADNVGNSSIFETHFFRSQKK